MSPVSKVVYEQETMCRPGRRPISWINVELGVPQGSILGPIFFLIYANDINNACSEADFTKFADDTTMTSGASLEEATDKMNLGVNKIDKWFKSNKVNLSPSKMRYMIFNCTTDKKTN